jgi:hypothetical protein
VVMSSGSSDRSWSDSHAERAHGLAVGLDGVPRLPGRAQVEFSDRQLATERTQLRVDSAHDDLADG